MVHPSAPTTAPENVGYVHRPGTDPTLPSVVMLHGLFGKLTNFNPLIPHIDPQVDVWVPELPIYTHADGTDTIEGLSIWLNDWLRSHAITSVVLLGNSLGGHIALDSAIRGNSAIRGLMLVGSSGLFDTGFGVSMPRRFDREYIHRKASEAFYQYAVDDAMVDEIHSVITDRQLLGKLVRLARSARQADTEHLLPHIDVPTCIVWGENDRITPPSVARKFNHLIAGSELRWITKCGHVPMLEQPRAFADIVNDFVLCFKKQTFEYERTVSTIL